MTIGNLHDAHRANRGRAVWGSRKALLHLVYSTSFKTRGLDESKSSTEQATRISQSCIYIRWESICFMCVETQKAYLYLYSANPSWSLHSERTQARKKRKTNPVGISVADSCTTAPSESRQTVAQSLESSSDIISATVPPCDSDVETINESNPMVAKWGNSKEQMKIHFASRFNTFFRRVATALDTPKYHIENRAEVDQWLQKVHLTKGDLGLEYSDHPPWAFIAEGNTFEWTQPSTTEEMFYKLTGSIDRMKGTGVEVRYNAHLTGMHYHYYIRRNTYGSQGRNRTLLSKLKAAHKKGCEAPLRDLRSQMESFITWYELCHICGYALIIHGDNIFEYLYNHKTLYDARDVIEGITEFLSQEWKNLSKGLGLLLDPLCK